MSTLKRSTQRLIKRFKQGKKYIAIGVKSSERLKEARSQTAKNLKDFRNKYPDGKAAHRRNLHKSDLRAVRPL